MKTLIQQDGDPIKVVAPATKASGDILFSANPADTSTLTLNGQTWTFVAGVAGANQTQIGVDLNATLDALVTGLNASIVTELAVATYSNAPTTATTLQIRMDAAGATGNAYTLAASANSNGVVSGATLRDGEGVTSGDGVAIGVLFGVACYSAVTGASLEISCRGVYDLPKSPSAALAVGDICWWDPAGHVVVPATGTGYLQIGVAVLAASAAARTVRVKLCTRAAAGV